MFLEQLNIVGKRSGAGFVAHKAILVNALSRALADRVIVMDITLGRRGLLGYLKALGGSNTSYLADGEWTGDKTPMTICDVRISPSNSVKPNVGASELADALSRVMWHLKGGFWEGE